MKGQFPAHNQLHEFTRQFRIQWLPLNQKTQHRAIGDGHGDNRIISLGKDGVVFYGSGKLSGMQRVADGNGEGALNGLGGVRVAAGLSPGQVLLHEITL